jgi:hypothetical protein
MPELSADQFHEHLEAFQRHLGVTFEPNAVVLPTGRRIHTVHQAIDLWPNRATGRTSENLYSDVAAESGAFHQLSAHLENPMEPPPFHPRLTFSMGSARPYPEREGLTHRTYKMRGQEDKIISSARFSPSDPNPAFRDPELFYANVQHGLRHSERPEEWALKDNRRWLQEQASKPRGIIQVNEEYPPRMGTRLYHFHVASGRLEFLKQEQH